MSNEGRYKNPVCRGCWALGNNCKTCERCIETRPLNSPSVAKLSESALLQNITRIIAFSDSVIAYGTQANMLAQEIVDELLPQIAALQANADTISITRECAGHLADNMRWIRDETMEDWCSDDNECLSELEQALEAK